MPALFVFLLKVNIALIAFCLGYYLVLRRLTFYTLNRVYLGIAIIFSTVYPLINLDNFVQQHNIPVQNVIVNWKIPAENLVNPLIQQAIYWNWATLLFWVGAAFFAARLSMQLLSLYKLYKNSKPGVLQEHEVRIVKADISPFSFWQSIYINPDNLNPADLQSVLQHEQIHVKEWHTLDILLTEISAIFYWFNPGVWLMKKAVRENIEFITDRKILQKGMDSKAYQYSLLNVSFSATTAAGITNNFNFSTLKKRITMMNAKRSSNVNLMRYAFLVPAVLICLITISLSKAELVKKTKIAYKHISATVTELNKVINVAPVVIEKKITPQPKVADTVKKPGNVTVTSSASTITLTSPQSADTNKRAKITITGKPGVIDSPTYIINGNVVKSNTLSQLNPNDIQNVSILKEKNIKGIIIVTTKQPSTFSIGSAPTNGNNITVSGETSNNTDKLKEVTVTGYGTPKPLLKSVSIISKSSNSKIDNFSDKLIFIDNKEASAKDMKKLSAADIMSVSVNKNKDEIDKYGDKAKNGVIFIATKKSN